MQLLGKRSSLSTTSSPPRASFGDPIPAEEASGNKKPKVDSEDYDIFSCLACGRDACKYENGFTVFDVHDLQMYEYDPHEPYCRPCTYFDRERGAGFEHIREPIKTLVFAIMVLSKGFWCKHKFLGSNALDLKLKTWMKQKLFSEDMVDNNWKGLRRAVKEAMRYRRQKVVEAIKKAYMGQC